MFKLSCVPIILPGYEKSYAIIERSIHNDKDGHTMKSRKRDRNREE